MSRPSQSLSLRHQMALDLPPWLDLVSFTTGLRVDRDLGSFDFLRYRWLPQCLAIHVSLDEWLGPLCTQLVSHRHIYFGLRLTLSGTCQESIPFVLVRLLFRCLPFLGVSCIVSPNEQLSSTGVLFLCLLLVLG